MIEILEDIKELLLGNNRLAEYHSFARSQGFRFRRKYNPAALPLEILDTHLFRSTSRRKAIKGLAIKSYDKLQVHAQIFDLVVYNAWGKRETTVWLFDFDKILLPTFHIAPKSSLERLSGIFSSSDWSYVSSEFADKFNLETHHINKMQMLFTEQFADAVLGMKSCHVEANGKHLLIYDPNSMADPAEMHRNLLYGKEMAEIILHDDQLHKRDQY